MFGSEEQARKYERDQREYYNRYIRMRFSSEMEAVKFVLQVIEQGVTE